jgi:hypothetical protein
LTFSFLRNAAWLALSINLYVYQIVLMSTNIYLYVYQIVWYQQTSAGFCLWSKLKAQNAAMKQCCGTISHSILLLKLSIFTRLFVQQWFCFAFCLNVLFQIQHIL